MNLGTIHSQERISYNQLFSVVGTSLGSDRRIFPLSTLQDLGVDETDFADILFRCGIPFQNYFSAGSNKLHNQGRLAVVETAWHHYKNNNIEAGNAITKLIENKLDQLLTELTINDLYHIVNSFQPDNL